LALQGTIRLEDDIVNSSEAYICLADDAPGLASAAYMICPQAHSFTSLLSNYAGEQWRLVSEGIFTHALPAGLSAPDEDGFKIRLSVYPALADEVLRVVIPIIVQAGCPFKIISNTALLELVCARNSLKDSAADFLTIYPASEELFNDLTAQVRDATRDIKASQVPAPLTETNFRIALTSDNPWPGLDYYLPDEPSFFCGREEERLELAQLVERGLVTVVLGKPGVGKSSLLRAGLKPFFERTKLEPVYVHLQSAGPVHPLQQVRDAVNRVLRERQIEGAPFGEGQSLREYFCQPEAGWLAPGKIPVVPVLVFDPFEDVFASNGADQAVARPIEAFWRQLANLIENRGAETMGRPNRANVRAERLACKMIISLRPDHLPKLLERGGQIPSITRNHFVLKPFNGRKGIEAVLGPGRHLLDPANPEALAEQIVRRVAREVAPSSESPLAGAQAAEWLENFWVEPGLLNFFCQQLNEARKRSRKSETEAAFITAGLLEAESERIIEDFFRRKGVTRTAHPPPAQEIAEVKESQAPPEPAAPVLARTSTEPPEMAASVLAPDASAPLKTAASVLPSEASEPLEMVAAAPPTSEPTKPPELPKAELSPPVEAPVPAPPPNLPKAEPPTPVEPTVPLPPQLIVFEYRTPEEVRPSALVPVNRLGQPLPSHRHNRLLRRFRFLAYCVVVLMTVMFGVLFVLYLQEVQKQQTEAELQEYVSNLAAARKTFKSANRKLTVAESDLALKESNIQELAKKSREKEAEAQYAREENLRLAGEQTNNQARITQLNREKAQAESRLAQWTGMVNDLTNQIASLSRQTAELQARTATVFITNKVTVTNFAENPQVNTNAGKENPQAAAMENFPSILPASPMTSSRRELDLLLTEGQCVYSENGVKFRTLRPRDVLFEGAIIRTGPGSWSDFFIRRGGTTVRVAPESEVKVARLSEESQNGVPVMDTLLELRHGRVFTVVRALVPGSTLEITDAAGHSVIEGGGLGSYMITAPANSTDKLLLTRLRVVNQIGTSVIAPGQNYNAKDGAALSLVPSSWETMLIQLDELEAETDKAMSEPQHPASTTQK
jgi:hypothetical protein